MAAEKYPFKAFIEEDKSRYPLASEKGYYDPYNHFRIGDSGGFIMNINPGKFVNVHLLTEMADFFEEVLKSTKFAKKACNWVIGDVSAYLNKNNLSFKNIPCSSENLASLINVIEAGEISGKQGKVVFEEVMQGKDPKKVIEEKGMKQVSDDGAILAIVNSVLDANPQSIEDFKNGKDRAVGFLVGQVMKASRGQANPKRTNELIQEELKKR